MRGRHVRTNIPVGNDAAKLALPGMSMRVDESGDDNRVGGVDHLRLRRRFDLARHMSNLLALDEHITVGQPRPQAAE
jgi:hypothetical protein